MSGKGFDDFSRRLGARSTRRQVFGLFGRVTAMAAVASAAVPLLSSRSASAACLVEYPPADLNDCPNKRPHPQNVRTSNGCGAANDKFRPPASFLGEAAFTPACNGHDICWETCNISKAACDQTFGDGLRTACSNRYGASSPLLESACFVDAAAYQYAVEQHSGTAFDEAQKKDCECCHPVPQVYCGCNGQCYTNATDCTVDCHATLGCFSEICVPATADQCP